MKTYYFAIILFSLFAKGQVKSDNFLFQNETLKFEQILAAEAVQNYYVILVENNLNSSLKQIVKLKCNAPHSDYYLLNITGYDYNENQIETALAEFITYIEDRRKLFDADIHIMMNASRISTYVKNKKSLNRNQRLEVRIIDKIEKICN